MFFLFIHAENEWDQVSKINLILREKNNRYKFIYYFKVNLVVVVFSVFIYQRHF
jgi:hypothetical protein